MNSAPVPRDSDYDQKAAAHNIEIAQKDITILVDATHRHFETAYRTSLQVTLLFLSGWVVLATTTKLNIVSPYNLALPIGLLMLSLAFLILIAFAAYMQSARTMLAYTPLNLAIHKFFDAVCFGNQERIEDERKTMLIKADEFSAFQAKSLRRSKAMVYLAVVTFAVILASIIVTAVDMILFIDFKKH